MIGIEKRHKVGERGKEGDSASMSARQGGVDSDERWGKTVK